MTRAFALLLALTGLATLGVVAYLEANGVPARVIFMDHAGLDTYSSMWRARHVFGASRIVVVTQRFHLARHATSALPST